MRDFIKCPLTKVELRDLRNEIYKIDAITDICDPDKDWDILEQNENRLDEIINILERSRQAILEQSRKSMLKKRTGLRLVVDE